MAVLLKRFNSGYNKIFRKVPYEMFATSASDKEAYLRSWLGSDIKTSPGHVQPSAPAASQRLQRETANARHKVALSTDKFCHKRLAVTCLHVDWSISTAKFLESIAHMPRSSTCFLTLTNAPNDLNCDRVLNLTRQLEVSLISFWYPHAHTL